jgi:hypothetical protein
MSEFVNALVSEERNSLIPADKDYFGRLIGEWDFEWKDHLGTKDERCVKGEWIFSRILEGLGVQDLFICPSREERKKITVPDAEYGTTIRTYNPSTGFWEIYYCCDKENTRLEAVKEGDKIVLTEKEHGKMKWIFSEIEDNRFHWQNMMLIDGNWTLCCDCHAVRKRK